MQQMNVLLAHFTVKLCRPADGASQALNDAGATQSPPGEAAEGSGRRLSSRGGGISAAAATAVAQIRRRRSAARTHALHPHAPSSAAIILEADRAAAAVPAVPSAAPASAPGFADPTADAPGSSHLHNHAAHAQPGPATTRAADLSAAAPQQSDTSHAAYSQPAEAPHQAVAGTSRGGQPMDRAMSVSRPPLPYHAIRRSARLHKASDTAPAGAPQPGAGDQAYVHCASGHASAAGRPLPDDNTATEACGPCTRYALRTYS